MMTEMDEQVVKKCRSLNKDDCLKAVLRRHLVQNVNHEQILVLHPQKGVLEAVCTAIGWNIMNTKNATKLIDMINVDKVSTSPSEWLCVLLLLKNPTNIYEDSRLLVAMDHCYMLCVTHACDTGDPWVPWMVPFLPKKHTVNLNNLLINDLLITALCAQSSDSIEKNIDTMQVVKGVVLFCEDPRHEFFQKIFLKPTNGKTYNAHALNLWISLLILVDVTEGYQVYLKCQKWVTKSKNKTEFANDLGAPVKPGYMDKTKNKFVKDLFGHLKKIGEKGPQKWSEWISGPKSFLEALLTGNSVDQLLENLPLTELFRIKELFHKNLITQLTQIVINSKASFIDKQNDPNYFAPKRSDTAAENISTRYGLYNNVLNVWNTISRPYHFFEQSVGSAVDLLNRTMIPSINSEYSE